VAGGIPIGCPPRQEEPRLPRVVESAIVAHGPLSTDLVRRILARHRESIRDCYAAGLARDAMLSGSLLVDLVVLDTGESIHL